MCTNNKPQRLLCIVSNMDTGGAETFLMKMYRQLDRTRYQMDFVVSGDKRGYYEDEIERLGGRVFRITRKTKDFSAYRRELTLAVRDDGCPNVLRIGSDALSAIDLWVAKKAGASRLFMRSSNASDGKGVIGQFIQKAIRRPLTSIADVKIAPSELAAEYAFGPKAIRRGEVRYLHNALDLNQYQFSLEMRRSIRNELGLYDNSLVVGHVGRFTAQKNHEFLLKVFAELLKQRSDARLVLVGMGELEHNIREKAKVLGVLSNIIFTGLRSDIPALLSAFDVFVLPSLYEGMPNVVIEAQAAGLHCVVSDTVTREVNVTGDVAFLPFTDTDLWVNSVLCAGEAARVDKRNQMADAGYDINEEVKRFVTLVYGADDNARELQ